MHPETTRLEELRAWLRHLSLEDEFAALPRRVQARVLAEARSLPSLTAAPLGRLFAKMRNLEPG